HRGGAEQARVSSLHDAVQASRPGPRPSDSQVRPKRSAPSQASLATLTMPSPQRGGPEQRETSSAQDEVQASSPDPWPMPPQVAPRRSGPSQASTGWFAA